MNQNKIKLARIAWPPPPGPLLWTQRRADPQTRSEQDPSLTKAARELHENMRVMSRRGCRISFFSFMLKFYNFRKIFRLY